MGVWGTFSMALHLSFSPEKCSPDAFSLRNIHWPAEGRS